MSHMHTHTHAKPWKKGRRTSVGDGNVNLFKDTTLKKNERKDMNGGLSSEASNSGSHCDALVSEENKRG